MEAKGIPLLEYDPTIPAIIEPVQFIKNVGAPEHCVFCFFSEVIEDLKREGRLHIISIQKWEDLNRPLYAMDVGESRIAVFQPGVGAPLAAALMEEVIARGCRKFIACGGAGVLDRSIEVGKILIPTTALRDEGTSYHYLAPSREVQADSSVIAIIENVLQERNMEYIKVKTWTTDAPYRETLEKVKMRKAEGCSAVEMEAAAFMSVAQFRQVQFGQLLYGGDVVSDSSWDERQWQSKKGVRENLFHLAVDICLKL